MTQIPQNHLKHQFSHGNCVTIFYNINNYIFFFYESHLIPVKKCLQDLSFHTTHVSEPPSTPLEPDPPRVPSNVLENSVESFQYTAVFKAALCKEIYVEYLGFIQELLELIPSVRKNVLDTVRAHLNIDRIQNSFSNLNFDTLKPGVIQSVMIDELSLHLGYSLRSIGPPVSCCKLCKKSLSFHHSPDTDCFS